MIADLEKSGIANVVTLCDVDTRHAANTIAKYPTAKLHSDYRKLIEQHKDIDAVVICTPDHLHAPASLLAMRAGKHVYVEKPLAHSIGEARKMAPGLRPLEHLKKRCSHRDVGCLSNGYRFDENALTPLHVCLRQNNPPLRLGA